MTATQFMVNSAKKRRQSGSNASVNASPSIINALGRVPSRRVPLPPFFTREVSSYMAATSDRKKRVSVDEIVRFWGRIDDVWSLGRIDVERRVRSVVWVVSRRIV